MDRAWWILVPIAIVVWLVRKNAAQRETLDSVAAGAGWQSRRRSPFSAQVNGSWNGYSVSISDDPAGEYGDRSLETRIRGATGTRKMVITARSEPHWWKTEILPTPEVRLSNAGLNQELLVRSEDKGLADWLFAEEDLANLVRKFVSKGVISIDANGIKVIRTLAGTTDIGRLAEVARDDWNLSARLRQRISAR